jgi:hypothetical protein
MFQLAGKRPSNDLDLLHPAADHVLPGLIRPPLICLLHLPLRNSSSQRSESHPCVAAVSLAGDVISREGARIDRLQEGKALLEVSNGNSLTGVLKRGLGARRKRLAS